MYHTQQLRVKWLFEKLLSSECMCVYCAKRRFVLKKILLLMLISSAVQAGSLKLSNEGVAERNENIYLGSSAMAKTAQLYMFLNHSNSNIWLVRSVDGRGVQAGWDSYLPAGKSSVLMVNKNEMVFSCYLDGASSSIKKVDCQQYVSAQRIQKAKNMLANLDMGDYWLIEAKQPAELSASLDAQGVKL